MHQYPKLLLIFVSAFFVSNSLWGARLVLPQNRHAYYTEEPLELAVAGLTANTDAALELVPQGGNASPVTIPVRGDGSTVALIVPARTLAPGEYAVKVDGQDAAKITIASGVVDSTFLISQTVNQNELKKGGANFILGNAFSFGRLAPDGTGPLIANLRGARSPGLNAFDQAVAANLPTICYMYWTGYVTHKPFGSMKSWAAADMSEATRLLSFHTAQRLRRYSRNLVSVGTIDEPGLGWGKTPAGMTASGYPDWDETQWYEQRGWHYTNDPASRSDDDWTKYMTIRTAVLGENMKQAARDLRTVWPSIVFSTDLYALHAIMDGTDAMNQEANDFPTSHVFVDWGIDRLGVYSGVYLEQSHDPTSKLAQAMNGQLFAESVPQPNQSFAYRAALNGMLAAGCRSNWWLNTGGMSTSDLAAINNPAKAVGSLLMEASSSGHDVAVLWSFTEIAMREKDITAREARRKPGEKITLKVTDLPENSAIKDREIDINAYNVGGDYKETVLNTHYALSRAGYPAHILHERLLPRGVLKNYKTLVVVGQTFPLPPDVMKAIEGFVAGGGRIVVDESTTIGFDRAVVAPVTMKGTSYRWNALFTQPANTFKTVKEASYFQTNHFMDAPVREAVAPFKQAMHQTASQPRLETSSDELVSECHVAGDGLIYLVINGYEQLPDTPDDKRYWLYNHAAYRATFTLKGLPDGCVVYGMEGADWSNVGKVADPKAEILGDFEPSEMKVYLIAPRAPEGLHVSAAAEDGAISVTASLQNLKMPLPLTITVRDPRDAILYEVHRATNAEGNYAEPFPIGTNGVSGSYAVRVSSPVANLVGQTQVKFTSSQAAPQASMDTVRVFDGETIQSFLKGKPAVTIAVGSDEQKSIADKLVAELSKLGVKAVVKPEMQVLKKVYYPRVWNPYAKVYDATGLEQSLDGLQVETRITLATAASGEITMNSDDGKQFDNWRQPNSLVTIAGEGYVDWSGDSEVCYEPGVKLHVNPQRQITVINGTEKEERTTEAFREKWARPWTRLSSHVGGYQLPAQLPESYTTDSHLIVLGDSTTSHAVAVLQASDLLLQVVDEDYPGPGKSLVSFVWSPFAVEKNVILIGATDRAGLEAGAARLLQSGAQR